jgi:hypothetical protein
MLAISLGYLQEGVFKTKIIYCSLHWELAILLILIILLLLMITNYNGMIFPEGLEPKTRNVRGLTFK